MFPTGKLAVYSAQLVDFDRPDVFEKGRLVPIIYVYKSSNRSNSTISIRF